MQQQDELYAAQLQLAEVDFKRIKGYFPKLDHKGRRALLYSLDKLVENYSPEILQEKKGSFNYEIAKEIRISQGLTRKQLSNRLGIHEITLYKYETGRLIPSTESSKKYLIWLQQHQKTTT